MVLTASGVSPVSPTFLHVTSKHETIHVIQHGSNFRSLPKKTKHVWTKSCLNLLRWEFAIWESVTTQKKKSTYLSDLSCFEWCWAVLSGQLPCCRSTFLPYIMIVHWSFELWTHPFQFPCPSSWAVGVGSLTRSGWTWRSVSPQSSHLSNLTT